MFGGSGSVWSSSKIGAILWGGRMALMLLKIRSDEVIFFNQSMCVPLYSKSDL